MKTETLTNVLSKSLGKTIMSAEYHTEQLKGGSIGEVILVAGLAKTSCNVEEPFKLVLKIQKKWERHGDPDSWRREYDLYASDFNTMFSDALRWPDCYLAELNGDETQIWMEYINGISGNDLTIDMLELAALEIGRFQGRIHKQPEILQNIACLVDTGYMKRENGQWHMQTYKYEFLCSQQSRIPEHVRKMILKNPWNNSKTIEYNYLRSGECDIPEPLKRMLINMDDNRALIFRNMERLPVVFCHRDFWIENIFFSDGNIMLIDWDVAGWGYLGEDIASLIADDTKTENLHEYWRRLIPAYYKGLSEHMDVPLMRNNHIWEMIIIKFGYRLLQNYMFTRSLDVKSQLIKRLQKIYEMRDIGIHHIKQ